MAKSYPISKSDLVILRKFASWSNSFQVFEDERFEIGFLPKNSLNHLMIAEGYLTGKAPPPGHYSTAELKSQGKYVCEGKPYFDQPFVIDSNLESDEWTRFEISRDSFGRGWKFVTKTNGEKELHIVPMDEEATSFIDTYGSERQYRGPYPDTHGNERYMQGTEYEVCWLPPSFTIFPKASVNVGAPFMIRASFIKAMPLVDYSVTVFENHLFAFESIEHGFTVYLRGWMDEDHVEMKPYRFQEEDWVHGKTGHLQKQSAEVYGLTEQIKIK